MPLTRIQIVEFYSSFIMVNICLSGEKVIVFLNSIETNIMEVHLCIKYQEKNLFDFCTKHLINYRRALVVPGAVVGDHWSKVSHIYKQRDIYK